MSKKKNLKKMMRKNADKADRHGYDRHFYLEKLGIPIEQCGTNFCDKTDKRYRRWMKQRSLYGFDSRQTWNLDRIFYEWLYERLMMYKKEASKIIDLTFYKFTIDGREYTQIEAIDKLLSLLEKMLLAKENDDEKRIKRSKKIAKIWAEILPAMWW